MTPPEIRIGTSGYRYEHWQGVFYPEDLPREKWLQRYSESFTTVEINNTFYNLPSPEAIRSWTEQTGNDFRFAVKFSRYGTHMKKLKNPEETVDHFLAAIAPLERQLGPILVQLPPNWKVNPSRLDAFLARFPKQYEVAVEFRHPSWLCSEVFATLEKNNSALCVHDKIADHPQPEVADWCYYRFHGWDYGGSYSHQKLSAVADRLAELSSRGFDVHVYFNNDAEGYAPRNAGDLKRYLDNRISK